MACPPGAIGGERNEACGAARPGRWHTAARCRLRILRRGVPSADHPHAGRSDRRRGARGRGARGRARSRLARRPDPLRHRADRARLPAPALHARDPADRDRALARRRRARRPAPALADRRPDARLHGDRIVDRGADRRHARELGAAGGAASTRRTSRRWERAPRRRPRRAAPERHGHRPAREHGPEQRREGDGGGRHAGPHALLALSRDRPRRDAGRGRAAARGGAPGAERRRDAPARDS